MHTSSHTTTTEKPLHLLKRNGSYYYNRRVPKHAVEAFGLFIRVWLLRDHDQALDLASEITKRLDQIWNSKDPIIGVDIGALVEASKPQNQDLIA